MKQEYGDGLAILLVALGITFPPFRNYNNNYNFIM